MILKRTKKKRPIGGFQSVVKRDPVHKLGNDFMLHPEQDVETVTYIIPKKKKQ